MEWGVGPGLSPGPQSFDCHVTHCKCAWGFNYIVVPFTEFREFTEFQWVAVAVTDISEPRLIMLYTEGLTEPLRGWVKAYMPPTLQDSILHTRDLADSVPKTKTFSKPFVP
jgi:hypothetical protein